MITKIFEVRDRATFFVVVATLMEPGYGWNDAAVSWLLRRAGYGPNTRRVLVARADGGPAHHDKWNWTDRTMTAVHGFIEDNFGSLRSGDVVDAEYARGEKSAPARSERYELPDWIA